MYIYTFIHTCVCVRVHVGVVVGVVVRVSDRVWVCVRMCMYIQICKKKLITVYWYIQPIWPKSGPFRGVFWVIRFSTFENAFSWKTKKADPKHCENWRRESDCEFHKTSPMCERGKWRKQLRDLITQSLKQTPFGSGTSWSFFWPNTMAFELSFPQSDDLVL